MSKLLRAAFITVPLALIICGLWGIWGPYAAALGAGGLVWLDLQVSAWTEARK